MGNFLEGVGVFFRLINDPGVLLARAEVLDNIVIRTKQRAEEATKVKNKKRLYDRAARLEEKAAKLRKRAKAAGGDC